METSNSRKRSHSPSGLRADNHVARAAIKKKSKKQLTKSTNSTKSSEPRAMSVAKPKSLKRKRRREKGRVEDTSNPDLLKDATLLGASGQRDLKTSSLTSSQSRIEPAQAGSSINRKPSSAQGAGTNSSTAKFELTQESNGEAADVVATQRGKDAEKAQKARKAPRAREAATREAANQTHEIEDPSLSMTQRHSVTELDGQMGFSNDARAGTSVPGELLEPFQMDWDVIELRAAERIAADHVDWSKLTVDQRSRLTEHYIGHPSPLRAATSSSKGEGDSTSDDSEDDREDSSSNDATLVDNGLQRLEGSIPHLSRVVPASRPTIKFSHIGNPVAPRVGQVDTFKPLGNRRLSAAPTRFGTGGTLADTRAKFQRFSRALNKRRGAIDSDDSDSESSSESQSDDDGSASKAMVRGSIRETFAEQTSTLKQDPTESVIGSLQNTNAGTIAGQAGLDLGSLVEQDVSHDDIDEATTPQGGLPTKDDGNVEVAPQYAIRARSDVSSSSEGVEGEESRVQSQASGYNLTIQCGPRTTAAELNREGVFHDASDDGDDQETSEGAACRHSTAELVPLDKKPGPAVSGQDSAMLTSATEGGDDMDEGSNIPMCDTATDKQSITQVAPDSRPAHISGSSKPINTASSEVFTHNNDDGEGSKDGTTDDGNSTLTSESAGQEIILNDDGELVMASSTAAANYLAADRLVGTQPTDPILEQHEVDIDESTQDADDLGPADFVESGHPGPDVQTELEDPPDSPRCESNDEHQSNDLDNDSESSERQHEGTGNPTIMQAVNEDYQQQSTAPLQQTAGAGSVSFITSSKAGIGVEVSSSSQEQHHSGGTSGLYSSSHPHTNSKKTGQMSFQDFAIAAPALSVQDQEEQEEISDTIQSVFTDTRSLPEGEESDQITTNQAGHERELIKNNNSISQDSDQLSSTSANAAPRNKVYRAAPPHHAGPVSAGPVSAPELDLSDSDTDSSEAESVHVDIADNVEATTGLGPSCANTATDKRKPPRSRCPPWEDDNQQFGNLPPEVQAAIATALGTPQTSSAKKRKMTGNTSLHFSTPSKMGMSKKQRLSPPKTRSHQHDFIQGQENTPNIAPSHEAEPFSMTVESSEKTGEAPTSTLGARKKHSPSKKTGTVSEHFIGDRVDLYNTTAGKRRKVPAGQSANPFPAIDKPYFGIIQERTWHEPFWLIIATVFLNKTTGRQAAPTFWKIRKRWPTAADLAGADYDELFEMIKHLGLQHQRTKRLRALAAAWHVHPPEKGSRYRTLHYPNKGDGKEMKKDAVVDANADDCAGALEIAHIPGCGAYAYDSWRIFCRDVLRGVATDYNGANSAHSHFNGDGESHIKFEPEWKRVLPGDKELRACLRWMWLKEGIIWNPLTGEKRDATDIEMEKARRGELEIEDEEEAKFAAQAAGVDVVSPMNAARGDDALDESPVTGRSTTLLKSKQAVVDDGADWALENSQVLGDKENKAQVTVASRVQSEEEPKQKRSSRAVMKNAGPATVMRSARAKRQRSPATIQGEDKAASAVAKKQKKKMVVRNADVLKDEAPRRQGARLMENDGLV